MRAIIYLLYYREESTELSGQVIGQLNGLWADKKTPHCRSKATNNQRDF